MSKSKSKTPSKTAGRVRGPVQVTWGESLDKIRIDTVCITRCCVSNDKEEKERTMGTKYRVPYGLYRFRVYVSPTDAERTGFDQIDQNIMENALLNFPEEDRSSMRGEMVVRHVFNVKHESKYGNAPAHKIFERIKAQLKPGVSDPQSFNDYEISVDKKNLPEHVSISEITESHAISDNTFEPIQKRCEYEVFVDVKNGNPNGTPDAGGKPRQDSISGKGLMTDVCIKRKIRNFIQARYNSNTRKIFFQEGAILNNLISEPYDKDPEVREAFEAKKTNKKIDVESLAKKVLCRQYSDIRTFGAVLSTKNEEESEIEVSED